MKTYLLFLFLCSCLLACDINNHNTDIPIPLAKTYQDSSSLDLRSIQLEAEAHFPSQQPQNNIYSWLNDDDYHVESSLAHRFPTPQGYKRVNVEPHSFANWLRYLPLKPKGTPVYYYNGTQKYSYVHEAVVNIDTGKRNLQQCADAVMRLKAEYHYSKQEFNKIHFNFTSGDEVSFDHWRQGKKPIIKGNKVTFSPKGNTINNSYQNFKKYLNQIFTYAGTASLVKELKKVEIADIQAGDMFIQGGFPGHVVLVMDVAQDEAGQKMLMLAQSYMPAQDIHILKNLNYTNLSPWYPADFDNTLHTPEWTFNKSDARRFR